MPLNLTRLKSLLDNATKGPWEIVNGARNATRIMRVGRSEHEKPCISTFFRGHKENADLITTLVNSAPKLIEELTRLRAFVEELKAFHGELDWGPQKDPSGIGPAFNTVWRSFRDELLKKYSM